MNQRDRNRLHELLAFAKKLSTESYVGYPADAEEAARDDGYEQGKQSAALDIADKIESLFPELQPTK
jgi:hypothetical protein